MRLIFISVTWVHYTIRPLRQLHQWNNNHNNNNYLCNYNIVASVSAVEPNTAVHECYQLTGLTNQNKYVILLQVIYCSLSLCVSVSSFVISVMCVKLLDTWISPMGIKKNKTTRLHLFKVGTLMTLSISKHKHRVAWSSKFVNFVLQWILDLFSQWTQTWI